MGFDGQNEKTKIFKFFIKLMSYIYIQLISEALGHKDEVKKWLITAQIGG